MPAGDQAVCPKKGEVGIHCSYGCRSSRSSLIFLTNIRSPPHSHHALSGHHPLFCGLGQCHQPTEQDYCVHNGLCNFSFNGYQMSTSFMSSKVDVPPCLPQVSQFFWAWLVLEEISMRIISTTPIYKNVLM